MHITVDPPLAWLLGIMLTTMFVAMIVYPSVASKRQKEREWRADDLIVKSQEQQARNQALIERQEAMLVKAEKLLNQLNDRSSG